MVFYSPPYDRLAKVSVEEVLPHIIANLHNREKVKVEFAGVKVNVQSVRLRTFATQSIDCACCAVKGAFFAIERSVSKDGKPAGNYHLNLWGLNDFDEEILMTHDHKLARSLGGKDKLENTETMCGPCNWKKGGLEHKMGYSPDFKEEAVQRMKELRENAVQPRTPKSTM